MQRSCRSGWRLRRLWRRPLADRSVGSEDVRRRNDLVRRRISRVDRCQIHLVFADNYVDQRCFSFPLGRLRGIVKPELPGPSWSPDPGAISSVFIAPQAVRLFAEFSLKTTHLTAPSLKANLLRCPNRAPEVLPSRAAVWRQRPAARRRECQWQGREGRRSA